MANPLFFIGIIPHQNIGDEVTQFKNICAQKFHSQRALNAPPHITLFPPFRFNTQEMKSLGVRLDQIAENQINFFITLDGFAHFGRNVIYIQAQKEKKLYELQQGMSINLYEFLNVQKTDKKPFHPHMTIAFRDLSQEYFREAWTYFENINYFRVFEVNAFYLLVHTGKNWEVFRKFPFK